ncbi:hypothetical protein [Limnoraphis robusta]|uniref:Uncharacterized protein n=1 Tax=Limnoraphis robusta CCNP1315 TaxID=3110306 RepID=A0ABU5TT24_9CYAN|nr:hypothetical protein [Limnoraphis robusta]MEA5518042.1 hypothetical protein [Limnoraphis robusta CCNP1315]MEA5547825.1 hypothetical protein [Limnoraphis robusta CCNP1324]
MHKKLVNHCTINLTIIPDGPILIKSGKEGADPTKPDMEFVETYHTGGRSIYLPGSSLKGAIRAQDDMGQDIDILSVLSDIENQEDHQISTLYGLLRTIELNSTKTSNPFPNPIEFLNSFRCVTRSLTHPTFI